MRSVKHNGFGRFQVLEDGAPIGEVFAGPGAKERAEEFARNPPAPLSAFEKRRREIEGDRRHWAEVNAAINGPLDEELAELKAILEKRRDADEVRMLLDLFRPMLKAGKQARRRGRRIHTLPKKAA